jgi:hypothetical protein
MDCPASHTPGMTRHPGSVTGAEGKTNINDATKSQSSYFMIETKEG